MPVPPITLPVLPASVPLRVTPTDVSQFVRLEQCERFLRLRLSERAGHKFMETYDVAVQRITPLMTLSGRDFEDAVEGGLGGHFRSVSYAVKAGKAHDRPANNKEVIREAAALKAGEEVILFQTRLEVELNGWLLRGDVDLIKLSRAADSALHVLIADMKSTAEVKVEHRLQVAFYHLMLDALLASGSVAVATKRTGILFRPPVAPTPEEEAEVAPFREAAKTEFGLDGFLLELVADQDAYVQSAHDLVLGTDSTVRRVAGAELDTLPYSLSFKCDGCLYTEFCMKWSAEAEDLSLLP